MVVKRILLDICSSCQLTCELCACQGMRDFDPRYNATLEDMEILINRLKFLNTKVDILHIHGPGEPLLWKPFNQAIKMFVESGLFGKIELVTNGVAFKVIDEDVWSHLSVFLSRYPGVVIDEEITNKYRDRITILLRDIVYKMDNYPHVVMNNCSCYGPCYYKRKMFPHCGPPLFDAAKRAGVDPFLFAIDIEKWDPEVVYDKVLNPKVTYDRSLIPCGWCWSNGTFSASTETILHKFRN